jgi:DnaK suppressor protein
MTDRSEKVEQDVWGVPPYPLKDDETYMNERQCQHFAQILESWKNYLMQEVDVTVSHLKQEHAFYPDPVDQASQEEEFRLELRTRDRERHLIHKIEEAQHALELGDYGYCEDCSEEIGVRRLEARPTARKCIDCKTIEEIREKQTQL